MSVNKILKYIIYGGIWMLFLTPFLVSQSMFFPFVVLKNVFFRAVTILVLGSWSLLALRDDEYRPAKSWILWSFIAFTVSLFISNLLSPNVIKSFWSNYERMEGWVTVLHLLGLFVVLASALNTEKLWNRFLNTSIGVSVLMALYSILQLMGGITINQGGVRVDGTFGNATYLAIYMLFNIFIALFLLARHVQERSVYTKNLLGVKGWVYVGVMLLNTIILYHTATRGAILGLLGGLFLTFALTALFEKKNEKIRKASLMVSGAVVVVVLGFFMIRNTGFVQNSMTMARIASISLEDGTTKSRFLIWDMAYEGFKEKPVFGWGQESFIYVFSENYDPRMYGQEAWFDRAHNVFFDWLVAGGLVGIIFYMSLFGSALYYLWKRREEDDMSVLEKAILTGLLAGYFFHNLFVFDNVVSYMMFVSILALISYKRVVRADDKERIDREESLMRDYVLPTVFIVATLYGVGYFNIGAVKANKALLSGLKSVSVQKFDEGLANFDRALSYDNFANQEIREQLVQTSSSFANAQLPLDVKEKYFKKATDEMNKQLEQDPDNARLEVFLGSIYERYGFTEEALVHLERARELSPRKQNILLEIGAIYINEGRKEEGLEILKGVYESETSYELALLGYAMGLIHNGFDAEAEALLEERFGTALVANDLIINAYNSAGKKTKVIELLKTRLTQNPNDVQARFSLAAAYADIGNKTESIRILEETKSFVPNLVEQIDYYIGEIRAGRTP